MPTKIFGEGGGSQVGGDHKDTSITDANTARSFGSNATLYCRKGAAGAVYNTLFRFSLTGHIPEKAVVSSAILTVCRQNDSGGADTLSFSKMKTAWGINLTAAGNNEDPATAGQATWRRSKDFNGAGGDVGWDGGAFSSLDYESAETTQVVGVGDLAGVQYNVSIPLMTQEWVKNDSNNFGLVITQGNNPWNQFHSNDAANAADRPFLTVTYSLPADNPNSANSANNGINIGLMIGL